MNKGNFPYRAGSVLTILMLVLFFVSCNNSDTPKPRGYFRINLPEKNYRLFDSIYPFRAELPVYSEIAKDLNSPGEPFWINIVFPDFRANVHISYKKINANLNQYVEDSRALALKHIPKAESIHQSSINNQGKKVYGGIFEIEGTGAASTYQFYLTDSANHFIRGALYFNATPNNDSLAPVLDFIKKDINRFINTFEWK